MSIPYLAQAADHQQLEWHGGGIMSILLDAQKTDGQLTMLRSTLPAGAGDDVAAILVHDADVQAEAESSQVQKAA